MTRTIAFLNQKGGVGKTTTVVNIAAAMAEAGRRVGVIDMDPQAHLTLHLGIEPGPGDLTLYDLLMDEEVTCDEVWMKAKPNLIVLPADVDLAGTEIELSGEVDRVRRLSDKLKKSVQARELEFLLIDCPPSLGLLTLNALATAREVIVPMQAHFLALQGVARLLQTVGVVFEQVNSALQVSGIILCMFEGQTRLAGEVVENLNSFFAEGRDKNVPWRNCRVLQPPVRRNIKLAEAPSFGQAIFDYDKACPGAQDYRELADLLMRQWDTFMARRRVGGNKSEAANDNIAGVSGDDDGEAALAVEVENDPHIDEGEDDVEVKVAANIESADSGDSADRNGNSSGGIDEDLIAKLEHIE